MHHMPEFKYTGRDKSGKTVNGTITAETEADAKDALRKRNIAILSISEKVKKQLFKRTGAPRARVRAKELAVFTRQLSTMISAGIPMLESVEVLADQADDPGFKHALESICEEVRAGTDFSEAISHHPDVFKDLYVNMVRAGETSGKLDEILNRLAEYLEATESLRQEIKSAMTYPAVSLTMIVLIAGFLMIFIVPRFQDMFIKQLRMTNIPLPTKVMFSLSDFMRNEIRIWVPALAGIVILLFAFTRGSKGSYIKDMLMLKLPVLGTLFHKVALSRFARTFATLLQSGVPILATLDIVATTTGNKVLEEAIASASKNIQEGDPLAVPLAKSGMFPKMVTRMISIGERSGALETLLEKISDFYDIEVKTTVKQLTSLIEPLMIAIMGVFVGGIVMAVFLPIFSMAGSVGKR
jgi:type IV pilus assembly protein PilC